MKKNRRESRRGVILDLENIIDIEIAIEHSLTAERMYAIEYMRRDLRYVALNHYKKWKELKNTLRSIIHARRSSHGKWHRIHWFD